ncbi:hypothetical protein CPB84DRAFT_1782009 [Gymnopilus junonius]|uniref:SUZ domain-containing protein n=1 Tax=Gymnopilus junonius TaxID=109634 RepID=A0A9P5TMA1_GYMJU|nr:hypothetical protein CPB84DRAFT_1782009 [Gymnopilus junonius]
MPSLVISRGSSSSSSMQSLPLNQPPPMRILKRPSPAISPSQSSANVNSATETFQEREARYQAARERIFGTPIPTEEASEPGDKKTTASSSSSPKLTPPTSPSLPPSIKIVREPRGPSNSTSPKRDESRKSKGFEDRRNKRLPAPATISSPTSNQLPTSDISVQ